MFPQESVWHEKISIHALREEGDSISISVAFAFFRFLSTPSARRATGREPEYEYKVTISIHALREEGDLQVSAVSRSDFYFYPRPPRGGRRQTSESKPSSIKFLSTPSARRATSAPRASGLARKNFYPRPPRGGRQQKQRQNLYFQTNYTTFCTNLEEL